MAAEYEPGNELPPLDLESDTFADDVVKALSENQGMTLPVVVHNPNTGSASNFFISLIKEPGGTYLQFEGSFTDPDIESAFVRKKLEKFQPGIYRKKLNSV